MKVKIPNFLKWFFHSYIWVGILVLIVDIVTKNIICNTMTEGDSITLIDGFVSITYTVNRKAAFGIGSDNLVLNKIVYIVLAIIAVVAISIYFAKKQNVLPGYVKAAFAIIFAGAIGNVIDRIFYTPEYLHCYAGEPAGVIDWIDFFKGSSLHNLWHYIFNIADSGVVIGVFMLFAWIIIDEIKEYKTDKAKKKPNDDTKVLSNSEKEKIEQINKNRID